MEENYLFYQEYEEFYKMAKSSEAFHRFCQNAFGMDFSQDGFSDMRQIRRILEVIPEGKSRYHILDIGCGNGKMVGYLQNHFHQRQIPAYIYGFDYSHQAIEDAKASFHQCSAFKRAVIGAVEYPPETFDVILSMDTMYFAEDMVSFVGQIKNWLKEDGLFIAGYQEGEIVPKTENADTTKLAEALRKNGMSYTGEDITDESYEILENKRICTMALKEEFVKEGHGQWYDMLMGQTDYVKESLEVFRTKMARYFYVAKKE